MQQTYSSFGRLPALKYTNIRFVETQIGDSTKLDCYVMLTKSKHKSIAFEVEGTNSAGDLGAAASVSFQNRNLFRGSETFMIKFRGAYEVISGLQAGYANNNYTEFGVESSINFPNFYSLLCLLILNEKLGQLLNSACNITIRCVLNFCVQWLLLHGVISGRNVKNTTSY